MDDSKFSSAQRADFVSSSPLRFEKLVHIPVTIRIIDSLVNLFNYLDIYGPKIPWIFSIVSVFRFFQLVGGSIMAANINAFKPGTFTYKTMSTVTVLFHMLPVEYRGGNAFALQLVVDLVLDIMAFYLIYTAFRYKSTSVVPAISTWILCMFIAIFPFLLLPIIAQFAAQTTSAMIRGYLPRSPANFSIIGFTLFSILLWLWIIVSSYTKSIVFRPCSFASVQGTPQTRLIITTTMVTFATGLTTYLNRYWSVGCLLLSFFMYLYCSSTVFRCGTFIKEMHQILILSGSIISMCFCLANLYPLFTEKPWGPEIFLIFIVMYGFVFVGSYLFIKNRQRKELRHLDEIEDTGDIKIITPGRFKEMCVTGFTYCHPLCLSYKFFKLAIEEWSEDLEVYCLFTQFLAIYPEQEAQLTMACQNIGAMRNADKILQRSTLTSAANILKTRESNLTPELKNKISKLHKNFIKAKNKLRNVWDLILQGNINEMNTAIKTTKPIIEDCGTQLSFLLMQYPNNRFVARQNCLYLNDIKGDPVEARVAMDNLKKLNRGLKIFRDTVHNLGIEAFPHLPEFCLVNSDSTNDVQTLDSENTGTEEFFQDESLNPEAIEIIHKQIQNHEVPSINFTIWSSITCFIVLVMFPLIGLMVYFRFFRKELEEPVLITEGIAKTRVTLTFLAGYVGRVFLRKVDDPKHPGRQIMDQLDFDNVFKFEAFGGNHQGLDILKYGTGQIPISNAAISNIRKFKPNNPFMNKIRKSLFSNSVNFTLYFTKTDYIKTLSTVTDITYMIATHIGKIYEWKVFDAEHLSGSDSLTARNNNDGALHALDSSLQIMFDYFDDLKLTYNFRFKAVTIVLCAVCFIVYTSIYFAQMKKIRQNRQEILYVLTTLPKTMISNISASFSKLNKGDSVKSEVDLEVNRQEESIVKLFGSISDGAGAANGETVILIFTALIIIFSCISYWIILSGYIETTTKVVGKSSHINHLFGCAAYLYNTMATLFMIALGTYDPIFKDTILDLKYNIHRYSTRISIILDNFNALTIGNSEQGPFDGIKQVVEHASKAIICRDPVTPPKKFLDSVHCFSAPQQFHLTLALMKRYAEQMSQSPPVYPDPSEPVMNQLWQVGPIELYETFFYKAGNEIVPLIFRRIYDQNEKIIGVAVLFMIINAIFTAVIVFAAKYEHSFIKFCLALFLKCPPLAIFANNRVMELLSGVYAFKVEDTIERHSSYYDEVVNKLDIIVIVANDETGKIYSVNNAFTKTFGIENEEIETMTFNEFLTKAKFESTDDISKIFSSIIDVKYTNAKGENIYLEFSSVTVQGRRIVYAANQTQNVLHEKLIAHEKQKSDQMLMSILPASMVPRVQAGEKNISFAVQSVSVLFLDIVSFTPWCGSHDAHYVMRMLNIMFKELDALTSMHKTMMKIKCIGDCYMAAGGIFDEVNQPAVHAREVVDFGRGAIRTIHDINERENEKLQIRVGVNTGGPIVAGVIGTEKPTFEILGPAINVAHEMEHHGVPMKVHISRPVYELVYGQTFEIKERGEIVVKGSKMFTYLVEP